VSALAKHPRFRTLETEPWNGEAPVELLIERLETPAELFYVRNHAPVPEVDPKTYRLAIDGLVRQPLSLSLDDLRRDFRHLEVPATLQCAGNRRDELIRVRPVPGETPWSAGAIGHARWRGVPLGAVLEAAGLAEGAAHVAFAGLDRVEKRGEGFPFGGSIPLAKALAWGGSHGVLLAWEMNGEPLAPEHGFPLRVVVPGYIGARSVKWLEAIGVQEAPSDNHYQARAYKLFPPHVGPEDADWSRGLMLGELSLTSVMGSPGEGEEVAAEGVAVRGYAMAGGERTVERVEVSADGGRSWVVAEHESAPAGVWSLWRAEVELAEGEHELVCRAWDSAANTQPERVEPLWNFKGYMNNAWHRVRVVVTG
jgi:sulfite oxidase